MALLMMSSAFCLASAMVSAAFLSASWAFPWAATSPPASFRSASASAPLFPGWIVFLVRGVGGLGLHPCPDRLGFLAGVDDGPFGVGLGLGEELLALLLEGLLDDLLLPGHEFGRLRLGIQDDLLGPLLASAISSLASGSASREGSFCLPLCSAASSRAFLRIASASAWVWAMVSWRFCLSSLTRTSSCRL
jgi:hypothetical protein